MPARPAKRKLVKLAKACFPGRGANSRSGAVTTVTLAIQVAAQAGRRAFPWTVPITYRDGSCGPI
jgi:hypothetical protein